jgi:DnaJ-class molecular chaperone
MTSIKMVTVVLMITLFGLSSVVQLAHAEIYKWVDEKGTVHFTYDPETIPEKYREKTKSRPSGEESVTIEEKLRTRLEQEKQTIKDLRQQERYLEQENRRKAKKEFEDTLDRLRLRGAFKECDNCNGRGYVMRDVMESSGLSNWIEVTCPICQGMGYIRKK